jgi:hypothetical protein
MNPGSSTSNLFGPGRQLFLAEFRGGSQPARGIGEKLFSPIGPIILIFLKEVQAFASEAAKGTLRGLGEALVAKFQLT